MRIEHAIQRGAADAKQLRRAQFIAMAPLQHNFNVSANDHIEPPVSQVDACRWWERLRSKSVCHTQLIGYAWGRFSASSVLSTTGNRPVTDVPGGSDDAKARW